MDPFKPYQPKPHRPPPRLAAEEAEAVALSAVAFIVADERLLGRFAALTGCGADELRAGLSDRGFLGAVLDFILADEPTLLGFVEAEGLHPEAPMLARAKLPGWSPD